jgi:hypothetical protein
MFREAMVISTHIFLQFEFLSWLIIIEMMKQFIGILALLFVGCVMTILGLVVYAQKATGINTDVISAAIQVAGLLSCTIAACITYILVKYGVK